MSTREGEVEVVRSTMASMSDTNEPRELDVWMTATREQMKAVLVGGQPIAEWEVCIRLLYAVEGFLSELGRGGVRMDDDFPEAKYQEVKDLIEDYLYPEPLGEATGPSARLDAVRGIDRD